MDSDKKKKTREGVPFFASLQVKYALSYLVVITLVLALLNTYPALFWIGIGMIAVSAVFSLITLPVEYNASARAMEWLTGSYTLKGEQAAQAKEALAWAARTYLVAALSAVVTLIYYIGIARRQ